MLVRISVQPGDFFFIPSGTVHALGKGIVLLEIQQNSDLTYRIYDYNRIGLDGKKRNLHLAKALDVMTFEAARYHGKRSAGGEPGFKTTLASCRHFTVEKWLIQDSWDLFSLDGFILICVIKGKGELLFEDNALRLSKGSSIMIPVNMGTYQIKGNIEAIASYVHKDEGIRT